MSIPILLLHRTEYLYDRKVSLSPHLFRLKPTARVSVLIESYALAIQPSNPTTHWQQDLYDNSLVRVDFSEPTDKMSAEVRLKAILEPHNPFDFLIDSYALVFPFGYPRLIQNDLLSYLEITDHGPALSTFVKEAGTFRGDIISFLVKLNNVIFNRIDYVQRMEKGIRTCEETL